MQYSHSPRDGTSPIRYLDQKQFGMPSVQHSNSSRRQSSSRVASQQNNPMKQFLEQPSLENYSDLINQQHYSACEPIPVQCEDCHTYSESVVYIERTQYTWVMAFLMSFICFCWVPFVFKKFFQKIYHVCPGCDRLLGENDYLLGLLRRYKLDFL